MMNFLIFLFAIFYLILAKLRLDWAVLLIIIALPSYLIRFNVLTLPATLLELMIWLAFLVWVITNYHELKTKIKRIFKKDKNLVKVDYPFKWEIILLLIISFAAVAVAGFTNSALGIWKAYFFEPILFYILIFNIFRGNEGRKKVFLALAVSALVVSLLAIYQKITGQLIDNLLWQALATRRVVSFFGYPNAVGLFLGPIILLLIGYLVEKSRTQFKNSNFQFPISNFQTNSKFQIPKQYQYNIFNIIIVTLTIILSLLAIYFAKSKGALAGVAIGVVVFFFLAGRKRVKWGIIFFVLAAIIGISVCQSCRNYVLDKTIYSKSYQIRRAGWQEAKKMLLDGRIISGAGLANYQQAVAPYHQTGVFLEDYRDPRWLDKILASAEFRQKNWQPLEIYLYPHNIFLNFWTEIGLAGVLLFIWIIGKFLYLGFVNLFRNWKLEIRNSEGEKSNKFIVIGLMCSMIVIIIHGLVDAPYFKNDLAIMFWLLVALAGMINLDLKLSKNLK